MPDANVDIILVFLFFFCAKSNVRKGLNLMEIIELNYNLNERTLLTKMNFFNNWVMFLSMQ